jgi:hypothetical protein
MNKVALILWLSTIITITSVMIYFFVKVLTSKPKQEPDSYSENDDLPR